MLEGFVSFIERHPWATFAFVAIVFYYGLLGRLLFWLRRGLFFFLGKRGLGKHVLLRNSSTVPVFVALFDSKRFKRVSRQVRLDPGAKTSVSLYSSIPYVGEPLLGWSEQKADLVSGAPTFRWRSVGVALSQNFRDLEFVLKHPTAGGARHMGDVVMHTTFELAVLGRLDKSIRSNPLLSPALSSTFDDPQTALVETGVTTVCDAERKWLPLREKHTLPALEKLVGRPLTGQCRIGLFSSGGGVRAMVALGGVLEGLEKAGILPAVAYTGAVSGSCWGLSMFMRECEVMPDAPMLDVIEKLRVDMRYRLALPLLPAFAESMKLVLNAAARKVKYLQSQSLVSAYGAILAAAWPTSQNLSDQASCVLKGTVPMPLYAGGSIDFDSKRVISAEFTPLWCRYESECIPTTALGRRFDQGKSVSSDPELPMEDLIGMFGSAFCTTVEKIAENAFWIGEEGAAKLKAFVRETAVDLAWSGLRSTIENVGVANRDRALAIPLVYPLHVNNWGFDSESETHTPVTLPLFDAGIDCNMCWSFAECREIDLVIAIDSSEDVFGDSGYLTLQGLAKMRERDIAIKGKSRLPAVDVTDIGKVACRVFGSGENGEIVIVYIPTKSAPSDAFQLQQNVGPRGFANVANFNYKAEQFDQLYNLARDNMSKHASLIIKEISKLA